jgi:carboxypeptidase family protein
MGHPVAAQRVTGAIQGTVAGDAGNPLPGVAVSVRNQDTGLRRSAVTGTDGRYVIASLPVEGLYEVQAELTGFVTVVTKMVTLTPNETLVIDFTLRVSVRESVTVTAATPLVEVGRSAVQQTVNEQLVRTLPLLGRNFIHLASLTAGFTGNPSRPGLLGQQRARGRRKSFFEMAQRGADLLCRLRA